MKHESPMPGQLYAEVTRWTSSDGSDGSSPDCVITTDMDKANVITSMVAERVTHHKLLLDIDMPAKLLPSSTPGHHHLYIDHEIEQGAYFRLLDALVEVGLIQPGYAAASKARGYTALRLPWVKKDKKEEGDKK